MSLDSWILCVVVWLAAAGTLLWVLCNGERRGFERYIDALPDYPNRRLCRDCYTMNTLFIPVFIHSPWHLVYWRLVGGTPAPYEGQFIALVGNAQRMKLIAVLIYPDSQWDDILEAIRRIVQDDAEPGRIRWEP